MATYYWVGGSGNWNATSTANWSNASGGSSGFGPPTSADDVIFDAGSNTGTNPFTVTVTGTSSNPAVCRDFSTGGAGGALDGAMTLSMGATAVLDCYGSMTLPAVNLSISGTSGALTRFRATATGKTLTTNGVSFGNVGLIFNGVGGGWTLGSALTVAIGPSINVQAGTFDTGNYSMTLNSINASGTLTRSVLLGSSSITLQGSAPINLPDLTGLTWNSGTSTITCSATSPTFSGGGQTFYNMTFSSTTSGTATINGANTFNNLTFTSVGGTGFRFITLGANQTVQGTLTFGTANTAIRRMRIVSDSITVRRIITLNGTLAAVADVDFRDIGAAGTVATPWTGTRLGDCKNNNNISFNAPKTVYWNLAGSQNWSATGWATTNNGVPAVNNFPLAQDTATFTEAGAAGTVTIDANWQIGSLQMADGVSNRTTAFTLATGSVSPNFYGNVTLFSNLTLTGTGAVGFLGQGTTQTVTSAGITWTQPINATAANGTFKLADNLTNTGSAFTLTIGGLDLNNNTLTCTTFNSNNSNTRTIAFGTGNITVTGNATTVFTTQTATGLTVTGTPVVNSTYAGATGTRAINLGAAGEANAISVNITAGTDIVSLATTNGAYKNINFTGFAGSATFANSIWCFGNFTASTGMTFNAGTTTLSFRATSGTQTVTSNGKTMDFPVNVDAPGATVKIVGALTIATFRTFTLTAGTLDLNSNTLNCGVFNSSNSNTRSIAFGTGNITVTGNNSVVFNMSTVTGFTYTGTSNINLSYSGSVGTRTMNFTTGGTEANSLNFNITAGTDIIALPFIKRNMDFTGFSGTMLPGTSGTTNFYGDLKLSTGMTVAAGGTTFQFLATSGTQSITSNGKTIDTPFLINAPGAVVRFADALTQGATRLFQFSAGTLEFTVGTTSTFGSFVTSGTTPKTLRSTNSGRRATLFQDSGAVNATYITIKDISATSNGVYWNALVGSGAINGGNNIGWNFVPPTTVIGQKAFQFNAFQNNAFQIPVWLNNVDVFFYWDGQSDDSSAWTVQPNASSPWTVQ